MQTRVSTPTNCYYKHQKEILFKKNEKISHLRRLGELLGESWGKTGGARSIDRDYFAEISSFCVKRIVAVIDLEKELLGRLEWFEFQG